MPTIIALDASLSMTRAIPNQTVSDAITYHDLAIHGINQFLDHLNDNSKLEFVSLVYQFTCYSTHRKVLASIIKCIRIFSLIRDDFLPDQAFDE